MGTPWPWHQQTDPRSLGERVILRGISNLSADIPFRNLLPDLSTYIPYKRAADVNGRTSHGCTWVYPISRFEEGGFRNGWLFSSRCVERWGTIGSIDESRT